MISMPALLELNEVITRDKFDKCVNEEKRKEFLAALIKQAEVLEVTEQITECRDAKDNKISGARGLRQRPLHHKRRC